MEFQAVDDPLWKDLVQCYPFTYGMGGSPVPIHIHMDLAGPVNAGLDLLNAKATRRGRVNPDPL
jgi:hypothetical protein